GGDDVIEIDANPLDVVGNEIIVRVRDDGDLVTLLEPREGSRHLREGTKSRHRGDERAAVLRAVRQAVQPHRVLQTHGKDLLVRPVWFQHGLKAHDAKVTQELGFVNAVDAKTVLKRGPHYAIQIKINQRPVTIER